MSRGRRNLGADYSISTVSVTLVLLMLGVVGFLLINAYSSGTALRGELRFTLMLHSHTPDSVRRDIESRMGSNTAIETWSYISADEAAKEFREYIGTDFVAFLGENPIPASYELQLRDGFTDAAALSALEKQCLQWPGVEEVTYQQKLVEALLTHLAQLNWILGSFGALMLLITLMLISNTLRLAVASRRNEIATMKLVGATRSFIRRPFVLRSFTQGVVAGALASGILYLFVRALAEALPEVQLTVDVPTMILLFSGMIILGVIICTTFTTIAVNRYIDMDNPL